MQIALEPRHHQVVQVVQRKTTRPIFQLIQNNFYVDDCLVSVPTEMHAIALYKDIKAACAGCKGGFNLTQWMSNSKAAKVLDLDTETLPVERAWNSMECRK